MNANLLDAPAVRCAVLVGTPALSFHQPLCHHSIAFTMAGDIDDPHVLAANLRALANALDAPTVPDPDLISARARSAAFSANLARTDRFYAISTRFGSFSASRGIVTVSTPSSSLAVALALSASATV